MSGTDADPNRSSRLGCEPDFQALFESAPGLFVVLTPGMRVAAASDAYLRATMTRREEILDRNLSDVLPDHASRRMKNFPVLGPSGEIRDVIQRVEDISDFARLSHELRTPLTAILGFGRLLKRHVNEPENRESVEQILQAGRHHLPDISGEEVVREVQSDPVLRPTPVVILSADATPGHVTRLLAAGARAYLTKPPDVPRLLQVLEKMLPSR
jgi:CheY-like chemotaxis protein